MICLDIKVENKWSNYLSKIFSGIDLSKYEWVIRTDDIIYHVNNDINEGLFTADIMNGEEFSRCISRENYYMIFVDIKAYPIGSELTEMETFRDFDNSDCEFVFLCVDSQFINFYSKNQDISDRVCANCVGNDFIEVKSMSIEDAEKRGVIAW